jgi:MFS family permease
VSRVARRSFASLAVPNYRRFFAGQLVSVSGNWMQMVAETWLLLSLTGSGVVVGTAFALQFLPIMLFAPWGGLLADRLPKRQVLMATQAAMTVPALILFALVTAGAVEVWMVMALILVRGAVNALDNPTRQSFVIEMVGPDRVVNAVGLNSLLIHSARIVGPALASVVIALFGVAPCFALNALSFAAMLVALAGMDRGALSPSPPATREPAPIRSALRYVAADRRLAVPLALMAVVGTLGFNFQVVLPLLARFTFHGDASAYAALLAAMGAGAVLGALASGVRQQASLVALTGWAAAFGVLTLLVASAPTIELAALGLVPVGATTVLFAAGCNSALQLAAAPSMRGRVMALYAVVFLGSAPIGGPLAGWLSEAVDPRAGLVLAGLAGLAAAAGARAYAVTSAAKASNVAM